MATIKLIISIKNQFNSITKDIGIVDSKKPLIQGIMEKSGWSVYNGLSNLSPFKTITLVPYETINKKEEAMNIKVIMKYFIYKLFPYKK